VMVLFVPERAYDSREAAGPTTETVLKPSRCAGRSREARGSQRGEKV
jgi:hypothetical protein